MFTLQAVFEHLSDKFGTSTMGLEPFQDYSLDVRLCCDFCGLFDLVVK